MPLALTGSHTAVQFHCPAELSLILKKIEHFSKISLPVSQVAKFGIAKVILVFEGGVVKMRNNRKQSGYKI